jgi:hypothetical protein
MTLSYRTYQRLGVSIFRGKIPSSQMLAETATRLFDRADQIDRVTLQDLALDIRLAAMIYDRMSAIRTEIAAVAERTRDPDSARELRDLLDDTEGATPAETAGPGHNQPLDYETLTLLSGRLRNLADGLGTVAHAADLKLASLAVGRMANLRSRIGEIAEAALNQDSATTARDLREAIAEDETREGNT